MAETKSQNGVVSQKRGLGPHGLGDPDDKFLRKVEMEVLVPQKMRDRARDEKCVEEVKAFKECCADSNVLMVVKCRKQNTALKACLERWYKDETFKEECKQKYLEERSEYRQTGVPSKDAIKKSRRLPASS